MGGLRNAGEVFVFVVVMGLCWGREGLCCGRMGLAREGVEIGGEVGGDREEEKDGDEA